MSHNSEQPSCESLAPSGCRRLHEQRKKRSVNELGRTRTRFVLAGIFHSSSLGRTGDRRCPPCTVLGLPRSANYPPLACLYMPRKTGCRIFQLFLKPAKPFPLLHTGHAPSTFLTNQATLLRDQTGKTHFPPFVERVRDAHIQCDFRTNANTEDKNVSWRSWRARCPLGAIKGVITTLPLCCLASSVKI